MKKASILFAALAVVGSVTLVSCNGQSAKCASLTTAEQGFSSQLSSANKSIFCSQLTADQRAAAMRMAGQKDSQGNVMSADEAVQQQYQKSLGKSGGGCSVN